MILQWELNNTVDYTLAENPGKAFLDLQKVGDMYLAPIVYAELGSKAFRVIPHYYLLSFGVECTYTRLNQHAIAA
eukprot:6277310-Amphidinium_carterae.1